MTNLRSIYNTISTLRSEQNTRTVIQAFSLADINKFLMSFELPPYQGV